MISETKRYNRMHQLENTEANIALEPLLMAEKDRMVLKLFRQNCELEEDLMKDNPDWEFGTLFGLPIFHDVKKRGIMPHGYELFAHTNLFYGEELSKKYYTRSQGAYFEQITRRNADIPTFLTYINKITLITEFSSTHISSNDSVNSGIHRECPVKHNLALGAELTFLEIYR